MPELRTETRTTYGFRDAATGALVRVRISENGPNTYACGDRSYALSRDTHGPVFEVEDPLQAAIILHADQQWYNSAEDSPSWGDFETPGDLLPVRFDAVAVFEHGYPDAVETRRSTSPTPLPPAAVLSKVSQSRKGVGVLTRRYFGVLPPEDVHGVEMAVFGLPAEVDVEAVPGMLLMKAGDRIQHGVALAAVAVDEDYPVRDDEMDRMPAGAAPILVLFDAWPSRPTPLEFAAWTRVPAPDAPQSPRP
ncbi:hypothetical protein [Methylobacterium brachiatum]